MFDKLNPARNALRPLRMFSRFLRLAGYASAAHTGWRRLQVDHDVPLPAAINADRHVLTTEREGTISYYLDRTVSGRPLVLVHGVHIAGSAYDMMPIFEHYRNSRPVFAIDLPGFGFSDRERRPYTPEIFSEAILHLVRSVATAGLEPDIVALSLGSEFAVRAAVAEPQLFRSVALISPTGFSADAPQPGSARRMASDVAFALMRRGTIGQATFDLLASRASISWFLERYFRGPVDGAYREYAYATAHQPGAWHAPIAFLSGKLFTPDVRELVYARARLPAVVLHDQDPNTGFQELGDFVSKHPNWASVRIPRTRGMPQFEQRHATFAALDDFWSAIDAENALERTRDFRGQA